MYKLIKEDVAFGRDTQTVIERSEDREALLFRALDLHTEDDRLGRYGYLYWVEEEK